MESEKIDDVKVGFTPAHGSTEKTGCEEGTTVHIPNTQFLSSCTSSNRKLGNEMVPASEIHPVNKLKISCGPLLPPCEEKGKRRMVMSPPGISHLQEPESTTDNDLQVSNIGNLHRTGNKITLKTESAAAIRTDLMLDCDVNPDDNIISNSHTPPHNSRVCKNEEKGNGKALSEGDFCGRVSKDEEEDDSYESVESCNSAGILSSGKKRLSFEQQLIVGLRSKRTKQIEQTPGISSSSTKHDSSFMNWIWNMMKGFARPLDQKEVAPPLGLALTNPSGVHENLDTMMDNDIRPLNSRSVGFNSIFQSMYCPNRSAEGMTDFIRLGEESAEVELPDQLGSTDANLPTCLGKDSDDKVLKENLNELSLGNEVGHLVTPHILFQNSTTSQDKVLKENLNELSLGNEVGHLVTPHILFQNSTTSQDIVRACSSGNGNSNDFEYGRGETDHSPLSQEKRANDLRHTGDPLGSMWITRFSARSPCSLTEKEIGNPSAGGACESAQNSVDSFQDRAALEARECIDQDRSHPIVDRGSKNFGFNTESSVGFRQMENPTFRHKVDQILPSLRLKSFEAMASLFARRLDALKNIIPSSGLIDDSSKVTTTCIFCGQKGHHLQNCSEITEDELEDLLRNIKSYDNAEGSPCLCIRCFQLNHWAVACPNTSQMKNLEENSKSNVRLEEAFTGDGIVSSSVQVQRKSNENVISSSNFEKWQVSEVPKGILSAINALRLTRTDVLKWMNSQISLSHLDGYFLRLRLGKWERGLGGTGYYVACITGMQKKSLLENTRRSPISVNVGGIKCLVENQYISNHDFLEDELTAWWCTTSRCGIKIPSEEDLKIKGEEKKMLGF